MAYAKEHCWICVSGGSTCSSPRKKERAPRSKRKTDLEIEEVTITFSEYGLERIGQELEAERKAWREALGVPRGLRIPEKPLPESAAECQAEVDAGMKEQLEIQQILLGPSRPPDGPEVQVLVRRLHYLWVRCVKLGRALRDA